MARKHQLQIKRVYEPPTAENGARILVDRLWPRGIKKEDLQCDLWLKEVAPSNELRRWFKHDPDRWQEFRKRYRKELESREESWQTILDYVKQQDTTLLFAAKDVEHNHAVVLKDFVKEKR